jgi:hypothetical protein
MSQRQPTADFVFFSTGPATPGSQGRDKRLARRPTKVAAIALANMLARMAWAMMARGERYKEPAALGRVTGGLC